MRERRGSGDEATRSSGGLNSFRRLRLPSAASTSTPSAPACRSWASLETARRECCREAASLLSFSWQAAPTSRRLSRWARDGLTCESHHEPAPQPPNRKDRQPDTNAGRDAPAIAPSNIVRVSLGRLDDLMRMVGELVISRARLEDNLKNAEPEMPAPQWRALQETNLMIERQLRDLREGVMRVRMVPIGEIFERMRFVVRDLSREYQKKVRLELSGQETEIDKLLIERMMDPLLHLVRNAISHGLEPAAEREAARQAAGRHHLPARFHCG